MRISRDATSLLIKLIPRGSNLLIGLPVHAAGGALQLQGTTLEFHKQFGWPPGLSTIPSLFCPLFPTATAILCFCFSPSSSNHPSATGWKVQSKPDCAWAGFFLFLSAAICPKPA